MAFETEQFVSYAQNFEDVMLWRALKHVERGFYIDVGAWSPDKDSTTKAFYERGWRGIDIEPNSEWQADLAAKRPEDVILKVALSDRPGTHELFVFDGLGLSTMDSDIARMHLEDGWQGHPTEVEMSTLDLVWDEYVGERPVHFLKVDVEGFEERVLRGNDWGLHRPWIVLVESTRPMSQVECHEAWEPILLEAGYHLAYQDGLNRYYVAAEHRELMAALKAPPNVFDCFVVAGHRDAEQRAEAAEAGAAAALEQANAAREAMEREAARARSIQEEAAREVAESAARAGEADQRAAAAEQRAAAAEQRAAEALQRAEQAEAAAKEAAAHAEELGALVQNIYRSKSWRWTAPLRAVKHRLQAGREAQ